ncbi:7-cyano-7-deazaguanine synthase [Phaeobacter inhibens]|uniref:7-cyano-7-deazaguanine synthase n=1 Tax=Phaeobacter inhibens TaxID=221822 RepID=UPI0021A2AC24|nr:7-cyano-7-deazaguanine synthase [Phaeobacter inhibens]UWR62764.1 7-cyano-7-deazaguanine synthase [Phaeobacter inhibens]
MAKEQSVLMLSGGIDSVALAHYAKATGVNIGAAIFLDYGQEAAGRELHCARRLSLKLGFAFEPVNISGLKYLFYGMLSDDDYHPLMAECECNDPYAAHGIVATYAMLRGAANVLVGITMDDRKSAPKYPEYLEKFGSSISDLNGRPFEMRAPFIDM